ncbi:DUF1801 domain-containing protein [Roseitalea porphyridii]|uniref:DUF1801 domain-containing protein n=1 Tax=Roseitalea porphyridii TaxID=1852022 RepID=A0A4P6UYG1_9HYPH|nr:DUF1801 domain-containing protein [Roseitalea porphyridii]QBK29523.1 DUF1801 domain-containing protein [Roseitalea porphyridii]
MTGRARTLIVQAAETVPDLGPLAESIKWGEHSFTPQQPRTGSSVRIQTRDNGDEALMFICHTGLVDTFRDLYGDRLHLEGNRAIVLPYGEPVDEAAVRHCIALALTYHRRKRHRDR